MRTSFATSYRNSLADLQRVAQTLSDRQREVSSGKRINAPSDDPAGTQSAIAESTVTANMDQYIRAADSVTSRLTVVDTVLSDLIDKITQARSRLTSAQGSVLTDGQRQALSGELTGIRDALYSDMNTMFRGTYLFSGTASDTAPYAKDGAGDVTAYAGNSSTMSIDVAEQKSAQVTFSGDDVLKGSAANDLFTTLQNLIAAVDADDKTAMATAATELQDHFDRVVATQSQVGTDMTQLDDQRARLQALKRASQTRLQNEENVDYTEAITGLSQAETAYRAALAVAGRLGNISLLDFLR